jgi:uncharacterized coiled-coil DUF342 family protein
MSTKIKIETYLSSPIFTFVVGLLLGGFGLLAMSVASGDMLFQILALILTICGFSVAAYGFMGTLEGKRSKTLTKSELREIRGLSQQLKVSYPTYILKVHKLKEKHKVLHESFPEIRAHSNEFSAHLKMFHNRLAELVAQLHDNLQKQAPIMDDDSTDGIANRILWSDKQIELTQLNTTLKEIANSESPMVPENYRSVLSQVSSDFKRLDSGIIAYHELLIACNRETGVFDTIQELKQEAEEVDALMSQHEAELQKLETDTQSQYELSKLALSMFQERFEKIKANCEF